MDPRIAGLLHTGLGILSASGPSQRPVSFGQALGLGGQQGMQGYQQAQQMQMAQEQQKMQQQLFAAKMAEQQRAERERLATAQKVAAFKQQFPHLAPLVDLNPKLATERAFPEAKKPIVASPGSHILSGDDPSKSVYQVPEKAEKPDEFTRMLRAAGIDPESPDARRMAGERLRKMTTHAPAASANVTIKEETEFGKAVGKEMGGMYSDLLKADMNAPTTIAKYQRLGQLLGQVNTGKFRGTITEMKAAAKAMGFDLSSMGIADDVAPAQAARALSNMLALELRNPAGGAGMPGALSDKDREFLVQSIPGLENDPGAIGKMIEYRVKLAKREQEVARMARDYRRKNGKFDEGFFNELAEWSAKNTMFEGAVGASPAGGFRVLGVEKK